MCVLCGEVLQNLLVLAVVDIIAVDFQDDLSRLKPRPCGLPACKRVNTRSEVRGHRVV